jgi:hypothetical protein
MIRLAQQSNGGQLELLPIIRTKPLTLAIFETMFGKHILSEQEQKELKEYKKILKDR